MAFSFESIIHFNMYIFDLDKKCTRKEIREGIRVSAAPTNNCDSWKGFTIEKLFRGAEFSYEFLSGFKKNEISQDFRKIQQRTAKSRTYTEKASSIILIQMTIQHHIQMTCKLHPNSSDLEEMPSQLTQKHRIKLPANQAKSA